MARIFKLRVIRKGNNIHTTFFPGNEDQTFANLGTLIMDEADYALLGATLGIGQTDMHDHVKFIFEGEKEAGV